MYSKEFMSFLKSKKQNICITVRGDKVESCSLSESEIQALKTEFDNDEYKRLRKVEYDKLNQYELMYDDKFNGTNKWSEAIEAIKTKYPKPNGA